MDRWKEITIYVHGITPEKKVRPHTSTYKGLHSIVNAELQRLKKPLLGQPLMVEWGWEASQEADRYLARAEQKVADVTFKAIGRGKDFTVNPLRFGLSTARKMFLHGAADMFYYVSEDGKKTVRKTVFKKILHELVELSEKGNSIPKGISLTCIGHSAGSVILHDLLFNIFTTRYTKKNLPPAYTYLKAEDRKLLSAARMLAKNKEIRLRKLYTFGSPITPLMFRSNDLIAEVVKHPRKEKGFLKPEDIGIIAYDDLDNPRWANFWDKDDVISHPLEFLYDNRKGVIKDYCIDVSDRVFKAHSSYWTNKKMAEYIAKTY
jgi:hypothetical protein